MGTPSEDVPGFLLRSWSGFRVSGLGGRVGDVGLGVCMSRCLPEQVSGGCLGRYGAGREVSMWNVSSRATPVLQTQAWP